MPAPDDSSPAGAAAPTAASSSSTVDGTRSAAIDHVARLPAHADLTAHKIGRYQILRLLGAGGMGVVYEALDPSLDRRVALKVLRRSDRANQAARFTREARALARLQHPNVVAVYDTGDSEHGAFVVMQLVDGDSMERAMTAGAMPWRQAVAMVSAAGRGLAAAHAAGIVHRDVKPSNILVENDGTVRVGDFGLARWFQEATAAAPSRAPAPLDVTQTGAALGTPRYMAPEQHLGLPANDLADQFSLCVTLYEALYGVHPFLPPTLDMTIALAAMRADAVRPPPPERRVPRRIEQAVRRGLRFEPAERFPTVDALLAALQPPRARGRWTLAVAVAVAVAVALLALRPSRPVATAAVARAPRDTAVELARLTRFGDVAFPEVSPDGRRLAYQRGDGLYVRELADPGRPDRRVADRDTLSHWSPDGDRLLVQKDRAARILALDGAVMRTLPRGNYTWSTDDEVVGYLMADKEAVFLDLRSGATRRCRIPGDYEWLLWVEVSPRSGRAMAVVSARNRIAVWTFERDCGRMRPLLVDRNAAVTALRAVRWSADGDAIVMARPGHAGGVNLVVVPLAWPWMRPSIVEGVDLDWFSVGPEGSVYYAENDRSSHVWRLPASGAPTRLTEEARPRWKLEVAGGGALVTYLERSERSSVFVAQALDGAARTVLVEYPFAAGQVFAAALSPDQRQIAIAGDDGVVSFGRVIGRDGASPASPPRLEVTDVDSVTWSGDRLFFHGLRHDDFLVVDAQGRRSTLVADPGAGWLFEPALSPDGRTVAVFRHRDATYGLSIIDLETRAERSLVERMEPVGWSRDGAWIYASDRSSDWLWKVPATGGEPQRWLRAGALGDVVDAAATPDGDALVLVSNESSDLFVVPGVAR